MIARGFVRLASLLVPATSRKEWVREWEGELHALARRRGTGGVTHSVTPVGLVKGALPHALWLRRQHRTTNGKGSGTMQHVLLDIRYALRSFRRTPGFTAVAVLTLMMGIGATTAIFSVVDGILLRPLPYQSPDALVMVGSTSTRFPGLAPIAPADFFDWREQSSAFEHLVASDSYTLDLIGDAEAERVQGAGVTKGYFELLGVPPLLGRRFRPEDDLAGSEPVAVLSYGLWQRRFGGDEEILGRTVSTVGQNFTVVGVMPQSFAHPEAFWVSGVELWIPLIHTGANLETRRGRFLQAIGRLGEGVSIHRARQEMDAIALALEEQYPENRGRKVLIAPLQEETVGDVGTSLAMLMGAVGLLLLIACANVANLFLARANARDVEMALRSALGAGRRRLLGQLLTEGVVLSVVGGGLGIALAFAAVRGFQVLNPGNLPRVSDVSVDGRVLLFSVALSLGVGVLFALAPALRVSRGGSGSLRDGAGHATSGSRQSRYRHALVAGEIALALVLVVGAGLFVQSFLRLRAVDPGFDPNGVVTVRLSLNARYDTPEKRVAFHGALVDRVETIPGVESVAYTTSPPLMGDRWVTGVRIDGREFDMSNPDVADYTVVSPGFFRTLAIQLVEGRSFVATDDTNHDLVLIVNEAFARYYWPGESALGKQVGMGRGGEDRYTVVGTVRDISRRALGQPADPEMHFSSLQRGVTDAVYVVRTAGELGTTIAAMRGIVSELDGDVPLQFDTMSNAVSQSVTQPRFYTAVLASFATLALVLAAVGVYGVMSYSVGQRVREMGIRVALGATRRDVMGLVMGWSGVFVAVGVLAGLAGAYAMSRLVGSLLYGVTATDALTFAAGAVVLVVVALAACYIPARRATGVDPVNVLR